MSLSLDQISALYSIITKLIALSLILVITPAIIEQLSERRLLGIKVSMLMMASMTFICILPVIYFQLLQLLKIDNDHLLPVTTIANSTSLLTTAGAMYVIYKGRQ